MIKENIKQAKEIDYVWYNSTSTIKRAKNHVG